jgi:hypothetical protein
MEGCECTVAILVVDVRDALDSEWQSKRQVSLREQLTLPASLRRFDVRRYKNAISKLRASPAIREGWILLGPAHAT